MMNKKEDKKLNLIFGKYECEIKDGAVSIPWVDKKELAFPIRYTVARLFDRIIIYVYDREILMDKEEIIDTGECMLDKKSKWIVPDSVLIALGSNNVIWLGVGDRAELTTQKALDEITISVDELKEAMIKLGF